MMRNMRAVWGALILLAALESSLHALDDEGRMRQFVIAEGKIEPFDIRGEHGDDKS